MSYYQPDYLLCFSLFKINGKEDYNYYVLMCVYSKSCGFAKNEGKEGKKLWFTI